MEHDNRIYIFEFKLNDNATNALRQIKERAYYKAYEGARREIYLVGINFSGQTKEVAEWLIEKM